MRLFPVLMPEIVVLLLPVHSLDLRPDKLVQCLLIVYVVSGVVAAAHGSDVNRDSFVHSNKVALFTNTISPPYMGSRQNVLL